MRRRLGVNVDHVATLRQARRARYPDPLAAALIAERAGAAQITVHIRGDRRHIQDDDLHRLAASVQTLLNVEAACTEEMAGILLAVRPHRVTLVAERPGEVTTEGGLDVAGQAAEVAAFAARLGAAGIHVALFIDPDAPQVDASCVAGVDMVELNTARWAETGDRRELVRLAAATERATAAGLSVGMNLRFANHPTTYVVSAISGTTVTIAQATGAATGAEVEVPSGTKMVFAAQPDTAAVGYARTVKVNPAVTAQPWRLRDGTSVATIGSLPQASEIPRAVIDSFERVQPFTSNSGLTLTAYVGSLIVSQSTARAGAKDALSAREALNEQFDQRFSADSGVNVDSELALMVEIQTSYAASAKVLQATRQLMDELLQVVR